MDGKFYDMDIQSNMSSGENSIEEMVRMAEKLKWNGITISDYVLKSSDLNRIEREISKVNTNLEIYLGAKIKAGNPRELEERVKLFREKVHVIIVHGGSLEINRKACEMPEVDILAHPELERKDSGLDHVMVRSASENHVAIGINFKEILDTYKKARTHILTHIKRNIMLCEKLSTPMICTSGAQSIYDLRAPRELISLLNTMGINPEKSPKLLTEVPEGIINRAREVMSEKFIRPGLKRVDTA